MTLAANAALLTACGGLLLAAAHDLAVRTVPNRLIALLALCGAGLASSHGRLLTSTSLACLLLLIGAALWLRGYVGGADVKLLAASGLVVAPGSVPSMLLATALAGGVLSLPYLPGKRLFAAPTPGRPAGLLARLLRCERWRLRRRGPLPYALAIAVGTIFVLLHGA